MLIRSLIAMVVILGSASATAEVYQWTDENGNTHFSDAPPADSETKTRTVTPQSNAIDTDSAAVRQRKAEQRQYLEERREEREKQAAQRDRREARESRQRERCKQMKGRLEHMKSISRFYDIKEDGSREYLSLEEAKKLRAQRRQRYQQECG